MALGQPDAQKCNICTKSELASGTPEKMFMQAYSAKTARGNKETGYPLLNGALFLK
jgi:hypothetical protein